MCRLLRHRLALSTIVTSLIILVAVVALGTAGLVFYQGNVQTFRQGMASSFADITSKNQEMLTVEAQIFRPSTQQFNFTFVNSGNIAINITTIQINSPTLTVTAIPSASISNTAQTSLISSNSKSITYVIPGSVIFPGTIYTSAIPYHGFTDPVSVTVTTSRGSVIKTQMVPNVGWYGSQWQFRKAITIDNTKVAATLSNFPVLINMSDTDLKNNAQSDGSDIVFTASDGSTLLNYEIENYTSSTGSLAAWVNIPVLYTTPKNVIYMYYGTLLGCGLQNPTGTWNSNYAAVYHLGDNPITPSGPVGLNNIKSVATTSDASGNAFLQNFDINFGQNRILIVGVIADGTSVDRVTYGSRSLTQVPGASPSNTVQGSIWYLLNPTCSQETITAHTVTPSKNIVIGAYALSGVDQTNPIPTVATPTIGNSASPSISITNAYGNSWVFDLAGVANGGGLNSPLQTNEWSTPDTTITSASSQAITPSQIITTNFGWTAGTSGPWIEMAIEVKPSCTCVSNIQFDAVSTQTGLGSTLTWTHTVGSSLSNSLLVVGVSISKHTLAGGTPGPVVSGIKYNNVPLTFAGSVVGSTASVRAEIWYLIKPAPGPNSVLVTLSTAPDGDGATAAAVSLQGVDQTTPIILPPATGSAESNNPSVSITTVNNNAWLIDTGIWDRPNAGGTQGAGQTKQWQVSPSGGGITGFGSTKPTTTHGSYTMSWTAAASDHWALIVAEIKPAGASAPLVPPIHDSTSNANHLTPNSMTAADLIQCKFGRCLNFDGSTKYLVRTNNLNNLNGMPGNSNSQTGSFWFWVPSNPATQDIYSLQNAGSSSYLQTGFSGSNSAAWEGSGSGTLLVSTSAPTAGNWHYFVYTYNATAPITNKLYIDGALKTSSTTTPNTAAPDSLYVSKYSGGQFFNGKIDELRISTITSSANWIATEYNNQASPSTFYTIGPIQYVIDMRSSN